MNLHRAHGRHVRTAPRRHWWLPDPEPKEN